MHRQRPLRTARQIERFVERLALARIGTTYNQYAHRAQLRDRITAYLRARTKSDYLLVGEAAGYRGARVSGIPFTSERQLTGTGPAEASATIVHRVLEDLNAEGDVLLWNVVPTHPGTAHSNRTPSRTEIEEGLGFVHELVVGRRVLAVGRIAQRALDAPYVRHPSHGGAHDFRDSLRRWLS